MEGAAHAGIEVFFGVRTQRREAARRGYPLPAHFRQAFGAEGVFERVAFFGA